MMLKDYKVIFIVVGLAGVLFFSYPTLTLFLKLPSGEEFSELWYVGPGHMAEDLPSNVTAGQNYRIYVNVVNHMGSSTYYVVYVKFRNQTDALPNATAGTPSPLPPLYEYHVFLQDGRSWEAPLTFSFSEVTELGSSVENLTINDDVFVVNKKTSWNFAKNGYFYQLLIELWIYNTESDSTVFHKPYVTLWLNMTQTT